MRNLSIAAVLCAALAIPASATVTSTASSVSYTGNGSTKAFTVPFKFLANTDLVVTVAGLTKTLTTDYTVKGAGNATGTVTFGTAPANGAAIVISRSVPLTQNATVRQVLPFPAGATIDTALDRATLQEQDTRALQAIHDAQQDAALTAFIATQSARDAAQNLALSQGVAGGNGTMVTPTGTSFGRTLADTFADQVSVRSFTGVTGNGTTDDAPGILAACNATVGRRLYFPAGTYRISTIMVCNSGSVWFEAGAQLSIDAAKSFTASGRVISLGGDPATGAGTLIYSKDGNFFANDNGFSFSKTPSTGTDDFFHIRRDIQGSTGIIIRNDDAVGTLTDSYIHLYGGPLTGGSQGSNLRFSAGNLANSGGLVNIVAQNDAAFSLINLASTPLDLYTAGVRQMQIASVPSAVNYWKFSGGLAASSVSLVPAGTDTNISAIYNTKGTGSMFFRTGVTPAFQFEVFDTAGAANRVRVTGGTNPTITTSAGNLTVGAPLVIGSGGTAISKSVRGTTTWNPGTVTSQSMVSTSITVTGAVTGADCIAGVTSPAPLSGFPVQCIVTATDTCGIAIINQQSISQAFGSATFYCRVFNP